MADKIRNLTIKMPEDLDAVIITSSVNRLYFTGLKSSAGTLLITKEKAYFIIDFRYIELAKRTIKNAEVILQEKLGEQLCVLVKKHQIKKIGVESGFMTIADYIAMSGMLGKDILSFDNRINDMIIEMRRYKSPEELKLMQAAQDIADRTFTHMLDFIKEGVTEKEISSEISRTNYLGGASGNSFETIVASGVNSSMPHAVPSDKKVQSGDFVTMDFGAVVEGYCSDMTRTVAVGQVRDEQRFVYDTVLKAQNAAFAVIAPGVPCRTVDAAARDLINAAGFQGCFGHGLGHSLGIEIHEEPRFNTVDPLSCAPGMLMSVEPGIYLEGRFGCRIEDVVTITGGGFVNLARSPKELIIL